MEPAHYSDFTMEYDELLTKHVGEFGRFQRQVVAILSLREIFSAFQFMGVIFLAATPNHLCTSNPGLDNTMFDNNCTFDERKGLGSPPRTADGIGYNACLKYGRNTSETLLFENKSCDNAHEIFLHSSNYTEVCTEWEYDTSQHADTLTTQWDLVCDNAWKKATIISSYLAGSGVGGFVAAWFSDRYGRKIVLLVCEGLANLCSFAAIYSPVFWVHILFKFLLAAFMTGSATSFVFASEMVGPKWRGFVGTYITLVWSIGYVLLSGIAFAMRFYSWKTLALVLAIPQASYFILVLFFVPESPRWLYLNDRYDEADRIVKIIAKGNKTLFPENVKIYETKTSRTTTTVIDLFRQPYIRKLTIIGNLNWAAVCFLYWGISMYTSSLGGNPYLNASICAGVELPALVFLPWIIGRFGRVKVYTLCTMAAGMGLLLTTAIPVEGYQGLVVSLSMLSKFLVTATVAILWVYTPESYPTCIRSQGLFTAVLCSNVVSILAPYVQLLEETHIRLPLVIYGLPSIFAGGLFAVLPETKNAPLMQSLEDGEDFLKNNWLTLRSFCSHMKGTKAIPVPSTEDERQALKYI